MELTVTKADLPWLKSIAAVAEKRGVAVSGDVSNKLTNTPNSIKVTTGKIFPKPLFYWSKEIQKFLGQIVNYGTRLFQIITARFLENGYMNYRSIMLSFDIKDSAQA